MNLNSDLKNTPSVKFESDQAIILKIIYVSSFFYPTNNVTQWKQKVAMATSQNNKHCQCMQNVSPKCKDKVEKCHFLFY